MEPDKIQHIDAGLSIVATAKGLGANDLQALCLSALAGGAKELFDLSGYGTPDPWDAGATALGGIAALLIIGLLLGTPQPHHNPEPRPSAGLPL